MKKDQTKEDPKTDEDKNKKEVSEEKAKEVPEKRDDPVKKNDDEGNKKTKDEGLGNPEEKKKEKDVNDEARNVLTQLDEEEKKKLEEKNRELQKKNQELKNTNGKIALSHILSSIELLRLSDNNQNNLVRKKNASTQASEPRSITKLKEQDQNVPPTQQHNIQKSDKSMQDSRRELKPSKRDQNFQITPASSSKNNQTEPSENNPKQNEQKHPEKQADIAAIQPTSKSTDELEKLKDENRQLKEKVKEFSGLRDEIQDLKEKLRSTEEKPQNRRDSESGNQAKIQKLSGENDNLRREINDIEDRFKREKERLDLIRDKDRRIMDAQEYDIRRLQTDNDELKRELLERKKDHSAEVSDLHAKLAKRDLSKKELQILLGELEEYKKEQERLTKERRESQEEAVNHNKHLRRELDKLETEVKDLRKQLMDRKRSRSPPVDHEFPMKKAPLKLVNRPVSTDKRDPSEQRNFNHPPKQRIVEIGMPPMEKFLLSLELLRLNFAYAGCRCGKLHNTISRSPERVNQDPPSNIRPSYDTTHQSSELSAVIKERDNLKKILSDYQRKVLEMKRQLDNNVNGRYSQSEPESYNPNTPDKDQNSRDILDKLKKLTLENARLQKQLELRDKYLHSTVNESNIERNPVRM